MATNMQITGAPRYHIYFFEKSDWTDINSHAWRVACESNESDITLTLAEASTICRGARCECEIFDRTDMRIGVIDIEGHYTPVVGANLLEAAREAHAGVAKLVLDKIAGLWVGASTDSRVVLRKIAQDLLGVQAANEWLERLSEQSKSWRVR